MPHPHEHGPRPGNQAVERVEDLRGHSQVAGGGMTPRAMLRVLEDEVQINGVWSNAGAAYWETLPERIESLVRTVETRTIQGALNTLNSVRDADFITVWYTAWLTQKLLR